MASDTATADAGTQTKLEPTTQALGDAELFNYVAETLNEEETFHYLGFEFLHRVNIVRIQNDLIAMRENMHRVRGRNFDKDNLNRLLNEYSVWLIWNCETFFLTHSQQMPCATITMCIQPLGWILRLPAFENNGSNGFSVPLPHLIGILCPSSHTTTTCMITPNTPSRISSVTNSGTGFLHGFLIRHRSVSTAGRSLRTENHQPRSRHWWTTSFG